MFDCFFFRQVHIRYCTDTYRYLGTTSYLLSSPFQVGVRSEECEKENEVKRGQKSKDALVKDAQIMLSKEQMSNDAALVGCTNQSVREVIKSPIDHRLPACLQLLAYIYIFLLRLLCNL